MARVRLSFECSRVGRREVPASRAVAADDTRRFAFCRRAIRCPDGQREREFASPKSANGTSMPSDSGPPVRRAKRGTGARHTAVQSGSFRSHPGRPHDSGCACRASPGKGRNSITQAPPGGVRRSVVMCSPRGRKLWRLGPSLIFRIRSAGRNVPGAAPCSNGGASWSSFLRSPRRLGSTTSSPSS